MGRIIDRCDKPLLIYYIDLTGMPRTVYEDKISSLIESMEDFHELYNILYVPVFNQSTRVECIYKGYTAETYNGNPLSIFDKIHELNESEKLDEKAESDLKILYRLYKIHILAKKGQN